MNEVTARALGALARAAGSERRSAPRRRGSRPPGEAGHRRPAAFTHGGLISGLLHAVDPAFGVEAGAP